ncbi:hypothetical protein Taro_026245 [Colocasia esculenta]|uniref:Mur ligase central domain-containing protein n=1 Tax=Colocasia esculenta TaxID=4460 RepID=A0A843VGJ4_COLES|nr:hypothetical protein [Colocasia esculenta]
MATSCRLLQQRVKPCRCGNKEQDLKGQTVVVVGLGKSGRSAARLALARGAAVLAVDGNEKMVPLEHDPLFADHANVQTILGYNEDTLPAADRVVVSPGVPIERYSLSALLRSGRQVMSELEFAAETLPAEVKVLAVSGTNGKSTVTTFAWQMLHHLGIEAFAGGNLGVPLSEAALEYFKSSSAHEVFQVAVVEVSSSQMEIPNRHFCPSVSVVLNLTPDHLERHKTMQNYAEMKCRLFSNMRHDRLAVLPTGNEYLEKAFCNYASKCNVARIGSFPGIKVDMDARVADFHFPNKYCAQLQLKDLKAIGEHNYQNAAVSAFAVIGLDVGINTDLMDGIVGRLTLLHHRVQVVCRDTNGVTWVDDSKATNVEATYTALMGLKEHKLIVLLGGLAKVVSPEISSGFEQLVEPLKHHRAVVTFGYSGGPIHETLCHGGLTIPCVRATNLEDAVNHARCIAQHGDTVILSPGCASFDEFRNFEHRGMVFQELALSMQKGNAQPFMGGRP